MTPIFKTTRGVALLISLSVIMLLSIGLTKTFEKKAVETAHLANTLSRFQAETLARSVFRAIAVSIKEKGLAFIVQNKTQWRDLPIPVPNGHFIIEEVKSIDHLFYLNEDFKQSGARTRTRMLMNIVNFIRQKQDSMAQEVIEMEISPLISGINDWIDKDDHPDEAYLYDRESYQDEKPRFEVKNRNFERLSEIRLLPDFRELGLSPGHMERHFRVLGKLTADYAKGETEHIDVNVVEREEMENFLARFKEVPPYEKAYDFRDEVMQIVFGEDDDYYENDRQNESASQFGMPNFTNAKTRFSKKEDLDEQMKSALGLSGANDLNILELFAVKTDYLEVNYRVGVDKTTLRINCVVKLSYHRNSLDIDKFKIMKFKIVR